MGRLALLLPALAIAACGGTTTTNNPPLGGGGNGGTPPVPTVHVIDPDTMAQPLAAGTAESFQAFTVPAATVTYQITERTTSVTQDSWTVAIVSASELARANAGQDYRGYGIETNVTGTISSSASVPADTYSLVIACANIVEDCVFSFQVQATY